MRERKNKRQSERKRKENVCVVKNERVRGKERKLSVYVKELKRSLHLCDIKKGERERGRDTGRKE